MQSLCYCAWRWSPGPGQKTGMQGPAGWSLGTPGCLAHHRDSTLGEGPGREGVTAPKGLEGRRVSPGPLRPPPGGAENMPRTGGLTVGGAPVHGQQRKGRGEASPASGGAGAGQPRAPGPGTSRRLRGERGLVKEGSPHTAPLGGLPAVGSSRLSSPVHHPPLTRAPAEPH